MLLSASACLQAMLILPPRLASTISTMQLCHRSSALMRFLPGSAFQPTCLSTCLSARRSICNVYSSRVGACSCKTAWTVSISIDSPGAQGQRAVSICDVYTAMHARKVMLGPSRSRHHPAQSQAIVLCCPRENLSRIVRSHLSYIATYIVMYICHICHICLFVTYIATS